MLGKVSVESNALLGKERGFIGVRCPTSFIGKECSSWKNLRKVSVESSALLGNGGEFIVVRCACVSEA